MSTPAHARVLQIGELKELKAGGKPLEKNQLDKIVTLETVQAELAALQLKLAETQQAGKWR